MSFIVRAPIIFLWAVFFTALAIAPVKGETFSNNSLQSMPDQYDVIVVGGDPEGVASAIGAARAGGHILLIDTRPELGGLFTHGWLNTIDLNLNPSRKLLNGGLFAEMYSRLDDQSFDVASMVTILTQMAEREKNLDIVTGILTVTPVIGTNTVSLFQPGQTLCPDDLNLPETLITRDRPQGLNKDVPVRVTGVKIYSNNGLIRPVGCKILIDATQDADIAVAVGADWKPYGEDIWGKERNMAATLVFRLENISDGDWKVMCESLTQQKGSGKVLGGKRKSIWGFGEILQKYTSSNGRIHVRALNLGRQNDGSVLVNAMLIYAVNGLSRESRIEARKRAETELPKLQNYLQKSIPGMASVKITKTAPELYIRTSRQIVSQYILTVDDVLENCDFPDRIGFGSYPLDIQAQSQEEKGDVTGNPAQYAIPLRSLIPIGLSNLLVVGRSAGFDSLAQSSARTIPVGMAAGQAAGVAAIVSIKRSITIDRIASDAATVFEIHYLLTNQGVNVKANPAKPPVIVSHWAYPGLKFMRKRGQISGGYKNEYGLDEPMGVKAFINRLIHLVPDLAQDARKSLYDFSSSSEKMTNGEACSLLYWIDGQVTGHQTHFQPDVGANRSVLLNWISKHGLQKQPWPARQLDLNCQLTRGAAYMLLFRWHNLKHR